MADIYQSDTRSDIEKYIVPKAPPTVYYLPDFISEQEEEYLIRHVNDSPKPKWTQLLNRRLQNWWLNKYCAKISALEAFGGKLANHVLINEYRAGQGIMPHLDGDLYYPTVSTITLGSHSLLNFYRPLSDSNSDSPHNNSATPELSKQIQNCPDACAEVTDLSSRRVTSVLLERRSLVLIRDAMYHHYLHGIDEVLEDAPASPHVCNLDSCRARAGQTLERATRISLTIRHVPTVFKVKFPFGKR